MEPAVVDDVVDDDEMQEGRINLKLFILQIVCFVLYILDTSVDHPEVKSSKVKGLFKPPTHSELQSLKETQDLFSSNLMRLQVNIAKKISLQQILH